MTMDTQKNYKTLEDQKSSPNIECAKSSQVLKSDMQSTVLNTTKPSKRSFDVAFLMMPDERIRPKFNEKQLRISKQLFNNEEWDPSFKSSMRNQTNKDDDCIEEGQEVGRSYYNDRVRANNNISPNLGTDVNIDVGTDEYPSKVSYCSDSDNSDRSRSRPNSNESATRPKFESPYKNKIFDDPALISTQTKARYENRYLEKPPDMSPKSAFTKVSNFALRSPNPSMSPDNVLYQDSISPPLSGLSSSTLNKAPAFNNLLSSAHLINGNSFFRNQMSTPSSSSNYVESTRPSPYRSDFHPEKQAEPKMPHNSSKLNFMPFRADMSPYLPGASSYPFSVQNFQSPNSDFVKMSREREPSNPMIVNPAAAILSTLLPPTLAAFSLPAQNVCAKCNISFRMTSDLVYHMRTHHKSESIADPHRRKREEKLKCSVCNESFRERHHLTRHMTAHQDKEGDNETPQSYNKKNKQYFAQNMTTMLQK